MFEDSNIVSLFVEEVPIVNGVYVTSSGSNSENQHQTNTTFSDKWINYSKEEIEKQERLFNFQKKWYLDLYGFSQEEDFGVFLKKQTVILDAGCGLGYKAKWFADLNPDALVVGMDYSDAAFVARQRYADTKNLVFVKGDIADTKLKNGTVSFVSCDQVIHHTDYPQNTMKELSRVLQGAGELAVYVYAKKAVPRELLDNYFRKETKKISSDDMWRLSEQLAELGEKLSELDVEFESPDIPLLGIKGGKIDIQRFIYWNFLKCFWNKELGWETSVLTNFDWYSPSNAERYSQGEFIRMTENSGLVTEFIHTEESCHSGRFKKCVE